MGGCWPLRAKTPRRDFGRLRAASLSANPSKTPPGLCGVLPSAPTVKLLRPQAKVAFGYGTSTPIPGARGLASAPTAICPWPSGSSTWERVLRTIAHARLPLQATALPLRIGSAASQVAFILEPKRFNSVPGTVANRAAACLFVSRSAQTSIGARTPRANR